VPPLTWCDTTGAAVAIDALSGFVDRGADGFAKLRRRNGHHGSNNSQQNRVFGRRSAICVAPVGGEE
jgi:hypothetical protein